LWPFNNKKGEGFLGGGCVLRLMVIAACCSGRGEQGGGTAQKHIADASKASSSTIGGIDCGALLVGRGAAAIASGLAASDGGDGGGDSCGDSGDDGDDGPDTGGVLGFGSMIFFSGNSGGGMRSIGVRGEWPGVRWHGGVLCFGDRSPTFFGGSTSNSLAVSSEGDDDSGDDGIED
jgi:hypothetical protein